MDNTEKATDNQLIRRRAIKNDQPVKIQQNADLTQNDKDLEDFIKTINKETRHDPTLLSILKSEE